MKKDVTNPEFRLGGGAYSPPQQTPNDLVESLKRNSRVAHLFRRKGYITSSDWSLITFNNFDRDQNCADPKDKRCKEWADLAFDNLKAVEKYLSQELRNSTIELEFIGRDEDECALFDRNRYSNGKIDSKMHEIFDDE